MSALVPADAITGRQFSRTQVDLSRALVEAFDRPRKFGQAGNEGEITVTGRAKPTGEAGAYTVEFAEGQRAVRA